MLVVNLSDQDVLAIHVIAIRATVEAACIEHPIIPSGA